jgi:hypothetical protein
MEKKYFAVLLKEALSYLCDHGNSRSNSNISWAPGSVKGVSLTSLPKKNKLEKKKSTQETLIFGMIQNVLKRS